MNPAINDPGSCRVSQLAYFIPAQCVPGMNANPNNISASEGTWRKMLQRLVADYRVAEFHRRGRCQHVKPAWCNHRRAERHITGVDEMHAHPFRDLAGSAARR